MNPYSKPVLAFRWVVFLLAAFYCLHEIFMASYAQAFGPFRFLTIWALLLSFFCASRLLAYTEGRSQRRWDVLIAAVAVVNLMVVFLYWRLFLADPNSVTPDGELSIWWREYYLHLLGPLLMWIDAIVINRPFRRFFASAFVLMVIAGAYFAWAELVLEPLNDRPVGSVTTGLPYPFLNNLELEARLSFYITNTGVALGALAGFFALGWIVTRIFGDRPA
ncbi:MAG: hypothetical protein AAFY97_03245 [Pseudomonadota bacterium]